MGTGQQLTIVQRYTGLDVWDQLSVGITLFGDLPTVAYASRVTIPDITEAFNYNSENSIRAFGEYHISIDDREVQFRVDQEV